MNALTGSAARRIEYRPLSDLKADPRNPKAHNLDTIDQSIGRFGMVEAVVLDGRTGYIISGHGRTETLKRMEERGEGTPEGIHVDEDGRWLAPVITGWSSRTDSEAAAALIALNRTTELGGWVDDALLAMLDDLSAQDDGLSGVGYDETEIDALRAKLAYLDSVDEHERDDDTDDGDDLPDDLSVDTGNTEEVTVVVHKGRKPEVYAALLDHPAVVDVRDKLR